MLAANVVSAGAVNTFSALAVNELGLVRVATTSPGRLSLPFSLIVTAVVWLVVTLKIWTEISEMVYPPGFAPVVKLSARKLLDPFASIVSAVFDTRVTCVCAWTGAVWEARAMKINVSTAIITAPADSLATVRRMPVAVRNVGVLAALLSTWFILSLLG